jgi:hypothetical protein
MKLMQGLMRKMGIRLADKEHYDTQAELMSAAQNTGSREILMII